MWAVHGGSFWALLAPLPVARGESTGEVGAQLFAHGASRAEFEAFIHIGLVSFAMRFFDCHEKADVAHCLVEIVLELLAPGDFFADEQSGARSENGGENRACADDEGADDLWIHEWLMLGGFLLLKLWVRVNPSIF